MKTSSLESLKVKAKLLQKKKRQTDPDYPLKKAYQTLAQSAGYQSWKAMKDAYLQSDILNPPYWSAIWKVWFSTRDEALKHLDDKHYLIPFQKNFFICDDNYIEALGLKTHDPLLDKVGNDWSNPMDKSAYESLIEKLKNRKL